MIKKCLKCAHNGPQNQLRFFMLFRIFIVLFLADTFKMLWKHFLIFYIGILPIITIEKKKK